MVLDKLKGIVTNVFGSDEDSYEEEQEIEEEIIQEEREVRKPLIKAEIKDENRKKFKINRFNSRSEGSGGVMSSVSIIRPKTFEDSRLIADSIKQRKVVNFSLEFLEFEVGQRVVDFVSGASYAMDAHLTKVTDKVLTCIPKGVDYEDIDTSLEDKL